MTDLRPAVTYALAGVLIGVASMLLPTLGIELVLALRSTPGPLWEIAVVNLLPPLAAGGAGIWLASAWLRRRQLFSSTFSGHLIRSFPLYLVAALGGWIVLSNRGNSDFWHLGQLVLWPWVAALGGLLVDGLQSLRCGPSVRSTEFRADAS